MTKLIFTLNKQKFYPNLTMLFFPFLASYDREVWEAPMDNLKQFITHPPKLHLITYSSFSTSRDN